MKQNLKGSVPVGDYNASCTGGAQRGKVMGQPFLVITSGIGPMQAESCVQLAMTICPSKLFPSEFQSQALGSIT